MQPYIINLFGYSCTGKSTVVDVLRSEIKGLYTVDVDVIKLQLSGYYWKNDRDKALELTTGMLNVAVDQKLPILFLMAPFTSSDEFNHRMRHAVESGYRIINIEMTAPEEVLIERYKARLADWSSHHTPKTLEEYIDVLHTPYHRPEKTIRYDSSEQTPEEIAGAIKQLLTD